MKTLLSLSFALLFGTLTASSAQAEVRVRDIGVIGLFSHDLFAWNSREQANTENSRIDLSTIFDFNGGRDWERGGNPKNAENAPVYSVTLRLVEFYKKRVRHYSYLGSPQMEFQARRETVALFLSWVRESFPRLMQQPFPSTGLRGDVTHREQAAMRALHDILPGRITLFRGGRTEEFVMTQFRVIQEYLSDEELDQPIPAFNGEYDPEYRKIWVPFRGDLDLKETDRKFVEEIAGLGRFDDLLAELRELTEGKRSVEQLTVTPELERMARKAICSADNAYADPVIRCE